MGRGTWVKLKYLKHSFPVELADYTVSQGIQDEPDFAWWIPYTLKKRVSIISKIKWKYWEGFTKFRIKIPKTQLEAEQFDKENKYTLWMDAICQEMKNVRIAFKKYDGEPNELIGYWDIELHLILTLTYLRTFAARHA